MLKLENVSFSYGKKQVLNNLHLEVQKGEHVSVIGESGCGKSTLLQLIYGLHHTTGRVTWKEHELLGPHFNLVPGEPFIKYLAQDFDLMPPLTVAENVGKFLSNIYPGKKKKRVKQLLEVVEMEQHAGIKAGKLSGGQQQRVALARALAKEPELILLDEPFSHIDQFRKNKLRRNVFRYLKQNAISCITATHDSTDALSFADKTIVLKSGKIIAQERPEQLYKNPPNKYVAALFGDINEISLNTLLPEARSTKKIILYPHELKVTGRGPWKVRVIESYFKGKNYLVEAAIAGETIYLEHHHFLPIGEEVLVEISMELIESRSR